MFAYGQSSRLERIHVGDVIEVDQIGGSEFDWRGRVGADGSLVGFDLYDEPINALCKTETEIAAEIEGGFRKILREPRFAVRIIDRSQRPTVTIEGAVKTPSRFRLMREVRLRELIALAGGLSDSVAGDIIISRQSAIACSERAVDPGGSGFEQISVSLKDLLAGKSDADVEIMLGDIIIVDKAAIVYIIGGVRTPGSVYIRGEESIRAAIDKAGGFSKDAVREQISVFRRGESGSEIIQCGLGKDALCDAEKTAAKPFDIIEVGAKGRPQRQYAPVFAAVEQAQNGSNKELPLRIIE
ncbi:MAG: SLBB domain-containing protein [Acidobacteria bacterium]|nr:SLBB domain-containing protein [Acidobacteriota bacterium]